MHTYPVYPKRKIHNLTGLWDFAFLGDRCNLAELKVDDITCCELMPVPSAFDTMPAYVGKRGTAVYRTRLQVTPNTKGRIRFQSVGMWCRVYVDGVAVTEHSGAFSAFWCELSASSNTEREIVVIVDNRFDFKRSPLQEAYYDFYHYGGILRGVEWHELADSYLKSITVTIRDYRKGEISAQVKFSGDSFTALEYAVDEGEFCPTDNLKIIDDTITLDLTVSNPRLWTPESPNLHKLTVRTNCDEMIVRFGLREIAVRGSDIYLNGEIVKLLGYCRHEAHPQFGSALPLAQIFADLQYLKDLGCNFIRGSHYPQDQRFLELCDEMGFLVWEESLGWNQKIEHALDDNYVNTLLHHTKEMIEASINHPSIIIWGFLNEGPSDNEQARELYQKLIAVCRELAPDRLLTYASNKLMQGDIFFDLVDIASINAYPGWYTENKDTNRPLAEIKTWIAEYVKRIDACSTTPKPIILSETGVGAIYGWHDNLNSFWTEEYQADCLQEICLEAIKNARISGIAIWQFCDCRTYTGAYAHKRPRCFNNKGTLDEYRRPKLAYKVVKEIFSTYPKQHNK